VAAPRLSDDDTEAVEDQRLDATNDVRLGLDGHVVEVVDD
jgi:hypothetical protein